MIKMTDGLPVNSVGKNARVDGLQRFRQMQMRKSIMNYQTRRAVPSTSSTNSGRQDGDSKKAEPIRNMNLFCTATNAGAGDGPSLHDSTGLFDHSSYDETNMGGQTWNIPGNTRTCNNQKSWDTNGDHLVIDIDAEIFNGGGQLGKDVHNEYLDNLSAEDPKLPHNGIKDNRELVTVPRVPGDALFVPDHIYWVVQKMLDGEVTLRFRNQVQLPSLDESTRSNIDNGFESVRASTFSNILPKSSLNDHNYEVSSAQAANNVDGVTAICEEDKQVYDFFNPEYSGTLSPPDLTHSSSDEELRLLDFNTRYK